MTDEHTVTDLIDEETEEEKQFLEHHSHQSPIHTLGVGTGMIHSATTDTLDSVYLEPPTLEQDVHDLQTSLEGASITTVDIKPVNQGGINLDIAVGGEPKEGLKVETKADEELFFSMTEIEDTKASNESPPSLSKYFGKDTNTDDPFSSNFFESFDKLEQPVESDKVEDEKMTSDLDVKTNEDASKNISDNIANFTFDDKSKLQEKVNDVNKEQDIKRRPTEGLNIESVDFELMLDANATVETPVDIEEKDDFESFTADIADTEALDALGMSPAAPSFMNDKNINDYFRQTSQTDSIQSLGLGRQISQNSGRSSINADMGIVDNIEEVSDNNGAPLTLSPAHVDMSEANLPAPDLSGHDKTRETKDSDSTKTTPTHQPMFPPSTTLSPVDSPAHQPLFNNDHQSSNQTTPEHRVTAFQNLSDGNDDIFSITVQMSDADRQHDAWLPSEGTKNILITMATHAPGTYFPDKELLCSPSLVITEPQGDPVKDLVYRYMGEQEALKRQILTSERVTQDPEGLKQLMKSGCYRSAIDLTGKLLGDIGQAVPSESPSLHTPESLQLWYCRFSLMMKLRMYSVMESEMAAFKNLDTPDIYYEFYPQIFTGKRGSMVAFGMRLLHAELPHHLGRSQETLDRLYYILAIIKRILKNLDDGLSEDGSAVTITSESRTASKDLWEERERRVLYLIGNTLVSLKDYDAALSVYECLMEKDISHKTALLSGLGRIHLQIGNMSKAGEYFQQVAQSSDEKTGNATLLMNKGFEAMCQNNFNDAYQSFKQAVLMEPKNTSAVNNMAVCCLYLGQLNDALKSLEALVHENPDKNLHEGILFNLCTLYELESSRALHKKQALLDLVNKHKGDGFPVVCLKMA
ncbi:Trafficking protein particle complex subunit 12 [Mactra antiquata]